MFDKDYHSDSKFMDLWSKTEDEELVPRVLIVSNRHQQGKTSTMIRLMEKVQEAHGRKFSIDDCNLSILEYMHRRKEVPEWTPLGLDEPQRGSNVGNKTQFSEEAQAFCEDIMATAWRHHPGIFALPHGHFLSLSIFGIATSQIVKSSKSQCELYGFERDMLNRSLKTYTPKIGTFTVSKPYAWDWLDYCKKREAFDTERGKILEERVASLGGKGSELGKEQVYLMVAGNPDRFKDSRGRVSQSVIETELRVSQAKANYAAVKFNRQRKTFEQAEVEA